MSDALQTQIDVLAEAARDRENIRNKLRAAHEQELAHMNELTADAQATSTRIKALAAELVRYEDRPAPSRTTAGSPGVRISKRTGLPVGQGGRGRKPGTKNKPKVVASTNGPTEGWARMPEPPAAEDWGTVPPTAAE